MTIQQDIITALGVKPTIDPFTEISISKNFIKNYLHKNSFLHTLVLGISGGQDSTLTGKICQLAINELRQETKKPYYKFIAVRLPYGEQPDENDCNDAINFIKPDHVLTINIKNAVLESVIALRAVGITLSDLVRGNNKARERMQVQYSIANMTAGIVVGTGHAAEAVTGFFTKYGDGGTDINPLFRLNKRQGRSMLEYLDCPKHLYLKVPTADLSDHSPAQSDESVLGLTYEIIDDYLEGKIVNDAAAHLIEYYYQRTKHKRHLPISIFDTF